MRRAQDSTDRWVRHYEWLQRYSSHEEAHRYAEELTQAGEERNPRIERSPLEIKREMKMKGHIEGSTGRTGPCWCSGVFLPPVCGSLAPLRLLRRPM